MSINTESYDDEIQHETPQPDIKALRKAADENPRLKKELEQVQRELAFVKAGIPLDDPKVTYFVKGYEGELDPTAIKQAAIEAGFIAPPQADPAAVQQQQSQQRVMEAASVTGEYDPAGVLYGLEQAAAEGGIDAMMAFGQQYGLRIADS